jgi:hypothetical protein
LSFLWRFLGPVFQQAFLFAIVSGWISMASAQESTFQLEAQTGSWRYQSVERNAAGGLLNQESGHLPVQGLQLDYRRGAWILSAGTSSASSSIDYVGVTQSGLPIVTATDFGLRQTMVNLAHAWQIAEGHKAALRLGLRSIALTRKIRPGPFNSALNETLDSTLAGFGFAYTSSFIVNPVLKWNLTFEVDWHRSISNNLSLDTLGKYDAATLEPSAFSLTQAMISAGFEHSSGVYGGLRLGLQRFSPGVSHSVVLRQNGQAVATASYPGSRQDLRYTGLFLGWKF